MKRQDVIERVIRLRELVKMSDCEDDKQEYIEELELLSEQLTKTESAYYDLDEYSSRREVISNAEARRVIDRDYYGECEEW